MRQFSGIYQQGFEVEVFRPCDSPYAWWVVRGDELNARQRPGVLPTGVIGRKWPRPALATTDNVIFPPTHRLQISSKMSLRLLVVSVGFLLGFTPPMVAQGRSDVRPLQERVPFIPEGQSVRITSGLLPFRTEATFEGFRADTLLAIRRSGETLAVPLSRIEQLEIHRKDRVRGALVGAPFGALLVTVALANFAPLGLDCGTCGVGADYALSALLGVPIGGGLGAAAGALIGISRWDSVPGIPIPREP